MALTERSRSVLYQGLSGLIDDEEAIGEMLSYFPARDVEEPVTKDFLRAQLSAYPTRLEVQAEFVAVRADIAELDRKQSANLTALDDKLSGQLTALDNKLSGHIDTLEGKSASIPALVHSEVQSALRWAIATMTALTTLIITAFAIALSLAR